jgi:ketosteroid isomerase-like protein
MRIRSAFPGYLVAAALAACAPIQSQEAAGPAVDSAAVVSAAVGYWPRWIAAVTSGDLAAMGGLLSDSVRLDLKGFPPMVGKAAFAATFEPLMKTMKMDSEVITPEQTTAISNELAYQTGDYVETMTSAGKTQTEYGRYAAAIGKSADGQWRLRYIMAFADSLVPVKK